MRVSVSSSLKQVMRSRVELWIVAVLLSLATLGFGAFNNAVFDERGNGQVLGANEVYVHDFATGETRSPWREAMRRHDVRTVRRGGTTLFSDGSVMLEEADQGRVLMLAPDGEEVWSYVSRASDGAVYEILASRWLDAEYGAEVVRSIASLDCGGLAMDCHHWIASPACEAEVR